MTIDERLERLTERHEALAQTVELLVAGQREAIAEQREAVAEQREFRKENQSILHEMMLAITRLANTAHAHNGQLADHQERIDKLEGR